MVKATLRIRLAEFPSCNNKEQKFCRPKPKGRTIKKNIGEKNLEVMKTLQQKGTYGCPIRKVRFNRRYRYGTFILTE